MAADHDVEIREVEIYQRTQNGAHLKVWYPVATLLFRQDEQVEGMIKVPIKGRDIFLDIDRCHYLVEHGEGVFCRFFNSTDNTTDYYFSDYPTAFNFKMRWKC